jgi:hypothetical protein
MESNHGQIKNKTANLLHSCRIFSLSCSQYIGIATECASILGPLLLALGEHCMISQLITSQSPRCSKQGSTKPLLPWPLATDRSLNLLAATRIEASGMCISALLVEAFGRAPFINLNKLQ